jgi:DNA repair protein RadD
MNAPALRDYQIAGVQQIRGAYAAGRRRVLFQLPTGGGKTICFAHILAGAAKRGSRVLVLVHRVELIAQVAGALELAGIAYGVIAPGRPETDDRVQIASVAALAHAHRLGRWRDRFDFIVVDECHHTVAGSWARVLASQPRAKMLGVTATPERLDGRGLGEIFDELIIGPPTGELIEADWLSKFTVYEPIADGPDMSAAKIRGGDFAVEAQRDAMDGVVVQSAVDEYARLCPGVPSVVFCVDRAHSEAVAQRFRAAGVRAQHLDGETPASERRTAIAGLANGSLDVICNCGLISEGIDVPSIGVVFLLRPTASPALYLQQVGRSLRPARGKERALILDFAGNVARHGLPDEPRQWSLDAKPRRPRERPDGPRLRRCKACTALNRPSARECANCGGNLKTPKERHELQVALEQAKRREEEDQIAMLPRYAQLDWAGGDERRLRTLARINGYKDGWVYYRLRDLAAQRGERANG